MNRNDEWIRFIEQLKSRNDIVDVISGYTRLERRGNLYLGCCPFHHEKTPSFTVYREQQTYKCFGGGCGVFGDVIKFVQEIESTEFMGAVEILAKRVGLEIPKRVRDDSGKEKLQKKTAHLGICREAAKFYHKALVSNAGKHARDYLAKRGISQEMITRFGLGVSPDWEGLPKHLKSMDFSLDDAVDAGIVGKKNGYFDALAQRLIVPIINAMGEVIAFGGRSFEAKPQAGKYVNTRQTLLFDKGKNLFGINLVKRKKQNSKIDSVLIAEGYFDVIVLHQAGFDTAVASMGTALTRDQAKLIKRYVEKVYICYDGDSAGQAATLKGLDVLKNEGLNVRVVTIPNNMDPDEFIRKHGAEAFEKLLESAMPLTDYKLKVLLNRFDFKNPNKTLADEARWMYASEALRVIDKADSLVEKESYLRLLQEQTGFSLDWLKREMTEGAKVPPKVAEQEVAETFRPDKLAKAKFFVLSCMLNNEPFAQIDFRPDTQNDEFLSRAFDYVADCRNEGRQANASMLFDLCGEDWQEKVDYTLNLRSDMTIVNEAAFQDCVAMLKGDEIAREIAKLEKMFADESDLERQREILTEIARLQKEKRKHADAVKKGETHDF